jgi:hypothetical protein
VCLYAATSATNYRSCSRFRQRRFTTVTVLLDFVCSYEATARTLHLVLFETFGRGGVGLPPRQMLSISSSAILRIRYAFCVGVSQSASSWLSRVPSSRPRSPPRRCSAAARHPGRLWALRTRQVTQPCLDLLLLTMAQSEQKGGSHAGSKPSDTRKSAKCRAALLRLRTYLPERTHHDVG